DEHDAAEIAAAGERTEHDGPKRRQTHAAGDDHQIVARGLVKAPAATVRSAHADHVPWPGSGQRATDGSDVADRLGQRSISRGRIAADRDRYIADADLVQ